MPADPAHWCVLCAKFIKNIAAADHEHCLQLQEWLARCMQQSFRANLDATHMYVEPNALHHLLFDLLLAWGSDLMSCPSFSESRI